MSANNTIPKRLLMAASAHRSREPIVSDELGRTLSFERLIIGCAVLARQIESMTHRHHVGCLLPNSVAGVVATFGCLFAHKAAAILNYTFPLPTLIRCCERAHIDTLLTSRQFIEKCDLTDLPGAGLGSRVELWGRNVSASAVAYGCGSIPYQLFCNLKRVPRLYSGG